ncbi:MAG: hypothetical protein OXM55_07305 [Bdellovibrionales bacterium]|nr:hypothetical protein [Bdellovibrionales bacterium]
MKKNRKIQSNKLKLLRSKFGNKIFTAKEASKYKVSPQLLFYYVKKNQVKRLSHGVYAFKDSIGFDSHSLLKEKLASVPQAIVGLESALKIYGLTDEAPESIHLVVPLSNVPKRKLQDVQLHQMKDNLYKKHVNTIKDIPVSSLERTIVDLLRFGYSISFVLSVLEESRKRKIPFNIGKIKKMASSYRVKGKVSRLLEVL